MLGRTPDEAERHYRRQLQRVLPTVTDQIASSFHGRQPSESPHELLLAKGEPARLGLRSSYTLTLKQFYEIAAQASLGSQSRWIVVLTGYAYRISEVNGQTILFYHWHPEIGQRVAQPHLHLDAGARVGRDELQRAHFPTNLISVADIVRFVIEELGIEPRRHDWQAVLAQAETSG